jgi:polyprenyl-phospho-N-acetylgalactosaminyl synthase
LIDKEFVYIVIPAYNEGRIIHRVIEELLFNQFSKIVVVNDGSSDQTREVVSKYPVFLLNHIIKRGQGAALHTGIQFVTAQDDCKYVVTFDADGQHRIADVENMIGLLEDTGKDIALGSRFIGLKNEGMPLGRKFILFWATYFLYFVYGLRLTDAHNGLRVLRKESAMKIAPSTDNMVHASEIIYLIKKYQLNYIECPVRILYTEYSLSKGQPTSSFIRLGILTMLHKIFILFFERD